MVVAQVSIPALTGNWAAEGASPELENGGMHLVTSKCVCDSAEVTYLGGFGCCKGARMGTALAAGYDWAGFMSDPP